MNNRAEKVSRVAILWRKTLYTGKTGKRHHDVIENIERTTGEIGIDGIEGFMTTKGRFVDRKEAARIAFEAGQISSLPELGDLYSEDLF